MRINVYWRGWDLLDLEVHVVRRRPDDECGPDCDHGSAMESSGNGQFELAEPMDMPDTRVRIGFR